MRIRRLLPSLCLAASVTPALAQFPSAKPTPPPFSLPTTPSDSRNQLSPQWLSHLAATAKARAEVQASLLKRGNTIILAQNHPVCYAMRSYTFAQQDPSSDRTTYQGSSTCEPAKDTHLKAIAVPKLP